MSLDGIKVLVFLIGVNISGIFVSIETVGPLISDVLLNDDLLVD